MAFKNVLFQHILSCTGQLLRPPPVCREFKAIIGEHTIFWAVVYWKEKGFAPVPTRCKRLISPGELAVAAHVISPNPAMPILNGDKVINVL